AMRPIAREYDECEHEKPWDFLNMMWAVSHSNPIGGTGDRKAKEGPSERNLGMCVSIEELSWGDAGLYLSIPNAGLGGAAVAAAGLVGGAATAGRPARRAGNKAVVVEAGHPGKYGTKGENKLGIRAPDTAALGFEDCRNPLDNILGRPEGPETKEGFKGVMAT